LTNAIFIEYFFLKFTPFRKIYTFDNLFFSNKKIANPQKLKANSQRQTAKI
jgi:hypothetical protein